MDHEIFRYEKSIQESFQETGKKRRKTFNFEVLD